MASVPHEPTPVQSPTWWLDVIERDEMPHPASCECEPCRLDRADAAPTACETVPDSHETLEDLGARWDREDRAKLEECRARWALEDAEVLARTARYEPPHDARCECEPCRLNRADAAITATLAEETSAPFEDDGAGLTFSEAIQAEIARYRALDNDFGDCLADRLAELAADVRLFGATTPAQLQDRRDAYEDIREAEARDAEMATLFNLRARD